MLRMQTCSQSHWMNAMWERELPHPPHCPCHHARQASSRFVQRAVGMHEGQGLAAHRAAVAVAVVMVATCTAKVAIGALASVALAVTEWSFSRKDACLRYSASCTRISLLSCRLRALVKPPPTRDLVIWRSCHLHRPCLTPWSHRHLGPSRPCHGSSLSRSSRSSDARVATLRAVRRPVVRRVARRSWRILTRSCRRARAAGTHVATASSSQRCS